MNKIVATLARKAELKPEQDTIIKLQAFNSRYFHRKSHFEDDYAQNYLSFQSMYRYFKTGNIGHILSWKPKGLSDESINCPTISDNSLAPSLNYIGAIKRLKFDGSCLKQDKLTFTHGKTVKICIVYDVNLWGHGYDDLT